MSRPDEGLIHAWLDGELAAAEAARVAALVENDPEWAAAAAKARGLIAASSRIISALDDVPAGVIPKAAPAASTVTKKERHWARSPRFLATAAMAATMLILVNVVPPKTGEVTKGIAVMPPEALIGTLDSAPPPRAAVEHDAAAPRRDGRAGTAVARERLLSAPPSAAAPVAQSQVAQSQVAQSQVAQSQAARTQVAQPQAAPALQQRDQVASTAGAASGSGLAMGGTGGGQRKDLAATDAKFDSLKKKADEAPIAAAQFRRAAPSADESRRMEASAAGRGPTILSMDDSSRHECFLERQPPMGVEPLQRVLRLNDTMAFPLALRAEAAAKSQANNNLNTKTAPARVLTAILRVKADTLFLPNPNATFSRAFKVACPKP